jgi:hypothetical protein
MVSITLTPDNANERRPRNVVHLIVAEGVTEIPEYLFEETKQLETIVFSKSVTIIGSLAFYWCINLRSVIFPNPNDSQLREIGFKAFSGCKSLKSIAIPDSVTTVQLESVLFNLVPTLNQSSSLINRVFRRLNVVLFIVVIHFNPLSFPSQ